MFITLGVLLLDILAGVAGVEPALTVLETGALPLNYTPNCFSIISYQVFNFNYLVLSVK